MSQPRSLTEQLRALENLQEIDLKIDQLTVQKNSFPSTLKSLDDSLSRTRAALQLKSTAIDELEKVQRQTRAALDLNKERLTRSNTRLEGVQNTNEFQAIQKELDQLRKLTATLEEQLKRSDADITTAKTAREAAQAEMDKAQGERETAATSLSGQSGQLDTQISALNGERTQFTSQVETRILSQYDRVRKARAGLGVVPAVGGRCQGCNMMVPPQLYNEVQRGSALHSCPSCHRLLFVKGEGPKA